MGNVLLHPQLNLAEAGRIASDQGGRLVWSRGRVRLVKAQVHVNAALAAAKHGEFVAALGHIDAARRQVEGLEVAICSV